MRPTFSLKQKHLFLCIAVIFISTEIPALDFSITGAGAYSNQANRSFFVDGSAAFSHTNGPFSVQGELTIDSMGVYPEPFLADFFGPFSFGIAKAGLRYDAQPLSLFVGKLPLEDIIKSPYSLFLTSAAISAMTGGFEYRSGNFGFSDRWIGLNRDIPAGLYQTEGSVIYQDRGAVLKSYSLNIGNLKLGYQDATIFNRAYFDIEVFTIPLPSAFVQAVLTASGRPTSRAGDQNSIMGFFGMYSGDTWEAFGQLLIDDFNMNRFINPSAYTNPDKLAWSIGADFDLSIGRLGFYTAGATRYTFESVRGEFYSYTLYPGSAVLSDGYPTSIPLEDQMLGYIHGENNLAFMTTLQSEERWGSQFKAGLEYTISGSKSPTNPWHNGEDWSTLGTQLLNDPVLEHKILLNVDVKKEWGQFTLFANVLAGYVFNKLNLVFPGDSSYPEYPIKTESYGAMKEPMYIPLKNDSSPILGLRVGGVWSYSF